MRITFSADKEVIERARAVARAQGSTLNDLLRKYIEELANQPNGEELAREFLELTAKSCGRSPEGWVFNREELYDRGARD